MNRTTRSFLTGALAALLVALPAAAQVRDRKEIKYPPLPPFQIAKPTVFQLKNGMTVFLVEDRELPLINVTARIRTGSNWEPADKVGLASVFGQVQRSGGTASMPGDAMDEYLAMRAATIETSVGGDAGYASMNCLTQDFDDVFKVFVDVLRHPAFPQDKIDVAKVQERTGIARRNDDINGMANRELRKLVYGADSPLARTSEYATIAAITRENLVAWHEKYYHPNDVYLGLVGDFDAKAMRKKIEAALGAWPKGPAFADPPAAFRREPNPGLWFIEKPDVTQATVGMAHLGIEMKNPDYFAAQVMNEILGGGFSARMFSNIRSKKGLAYSVGGGLGAGMSSPGLFNAGMQTKSASVFDAVAAMREEIKGIVDNPPSDEELVRAKESILNSFVFNYDSKAKILGQQMTYAFYGLPSDFLDTYRSNIEKVTKEDVSRVARKYVKPDALAVLIAGKSADFGKPIDTLGKVTKLDVTIPPPPDAAPKVAKTDAAAAEGRKALARAAAALGGKDSDKVKAIRSASKMTVTMQGQSISLGQTVLMVFPDKIRQSVQSPMGEQTMVLAGGEAFVSFGGQVRPLPAAMVEKARSDMGRDLRVIVRYASDPELEALAAGHEDVDGTPCDVVAVTLRGTTSRLWIAPDGRILKQSYQGENPATRAPGSVEVLYSDYRDLAGRKVPHKEIIKVDGQEAATLTLDAFEVDPEFDPAVFQKPAA